MTWAITGASGPLGRLATQHLLDRVDPGQVALLTRSPQALAATIPAGVAVRHGDFDDPEGLATSLAGVDRLLLISTDALDVRARQHAAAIDAAVRAGVGHIAYTSLPAPVPGNPIGFVTDAHRATEEHLARAGVAWTVLRNGVYAELQVPPAARAVAAGRLVTNAGTGRTTHISRDDCAAAAVAVLTTDGHHGRTYDLTGPELLDPPAIAAVLADLAGRPIAVELVDDEAMVADLVAHGLSGPAARITASFTAAVRSGHLGQRTDDVAELTGRAPRGLAEVLADHRDEVLGAAPLRTWGAAP